MKRFFRINNNGEDNMKFRILDESTINSMIEFLDDMQLQAAEDQDEVLLSFCQHMINQLINADEIVDNTDNLNNFTEDSLYKIYDYLTQIKNYTEDDAQKKGRKNRKKNEKKINKKKTKFKPHIEDISEYMTLKEIEEFLLDDPELTDYERFELYYEEHDRIQREKQRKKEEKNSTSYDKMLKDLNILPPDNKNK